VKHRLASPLVLGLACLAGCVPALLAVAAANATAGTLGGAAGANVAIVLAGAVFVSATVLLSMVRTPAAEGSRCAC
jgi:hypothetical protein